MTIYGHRAFLQISAHLESFTTRAVFPSVGLKFYRSGVGVLSYSPQLYQSTRIHCRFRRTDLTVLQLWTVARIARYITDESDDGIVAYAFLRHKCAFVVGIAYDVIDSNLLYFSRPFLVSFSQRVYRTAPRLISVNASRVR